MAAGSNNSSASDFKHAPRVGLCKRKAYPAYLAMILRGRFYHSSSQAGAKGGLGLADHPAINNKVIVLIKIGTTLHLKVLKTLLRARRFHCRRAVRFRSKRRSHIFRDRIFRTFA